MLLELNARDIALIRDVHVEFGEGLNIMTGETGAGKSVIIGSVMLALGGRASGDLIRRGAESAWAELVFSCDEALKAKLAGSAAQPDEEGLLVISRKLMPGRSLSRINGETVTLNELRKTASLLLDIYGQHEYQRLLSPEEHLKLLDDYLGKEAAPLREETAAAFRAYEGAKAELASFRMDEQQRLREADLCRFEISEIEAANLKDGEEEELSLLYRKLRNARSILEKLSGAAAALSGMQAGEAAEAVESVLKYDPGLEEILKELKDLQSVAESALFDLRAYCDSLDTDERTFRETEERLDLVRNLLAKYGRTAGEVRKYREKQEERLSFLENYEASRNEAEKRLRGAEKTLREAAEKLSRVRRKGAERLCAAVLSEMRDLGFSKASLTLSFEEKKPAADGCDTVRFLASLNPGEKLCPLDEIASGGELSRIMLAMKTVLADSDDIPTLIFDEVDAGISGRTAQKVAEKLSVISRSRQTVCITHLPQIAAMADTHFVIEKEEREGRNETCITRLDEAGSVRELARLLGGSDITGAVLRNAEEMRSLARGVKGAE